MRTNQIMVRRMGGLAVQQRTRDAFFNATLLAEQWNRETGDCKRVDHFLETGQTREFIAALIEDVEAENANEAEQNCGGLNTRKSGYLERAGIQGDVHTTKKWYVKDADRHGDANTTQKCDSESGDSQEDIHTCKNRYVENAVYQAHTNTRKSGDLGGLEGVGKERLRLVLATSRGRNGGTWMHPLLFIKFAMWLNPRFEVKVLKFVRDKMLEYRDDAGEAYKALSSAVARVVPADRMRAVMATVAKGINYVLWNAHSDGERNLHATDGDMRRLHEYERHLAATIDDGFIRSEEELVGHLRRQWGRRWGAGARPAAGAGRAARPARRRGDSPRGGRLRRPARGHRRGGLGAWGRQKKDMA